MVKKAFDVQDKKRPKLNRYSLSFIMEVVSEVESGKLSISDCNKKYNIIGTHTVKDWLKKYGQLNWIESGEDGLKSKRASMENKELKRLEAENHSLKTKVLVYEKLIELSKRELNIDLKKNFEQKLLKSLKDQEDVH